MTATERRATLILAAILILRMTALFMVLPVIAPYALALAGGPMLGVGLAVGAYGLTQALLQIPFGALSDRIGRKPVIAFGLLVFAAGSVMAAWAPSIESLILARLLQGGGAIAAASTALLSDLTRESVRTTAMAIVGASIGGAFMLALILGPALLSVTDVPGLFVLAAGAALLALLLLTALPEAPRPQAEVAQGSILLPQLVSLDLGVLLLHAMLAAVFLGLPLLLIERWGWPAERHWMIYLPVLLASLPPVLLMIRWLERRALVPAMIPPAVVLLLMGALVMDLPGWGLPIGLWLFFCAFNFLEASLPSRLASLAPAGTRGRAMGVFSSAQFLGAFVGASLGGWVLARWSAQAVLLSAGLWAGLWLLLLYARNELQNALGLFRAGASMGESLGPRN